MASNLAIRRVARRYLSRTDPSKPPKNDKWELDAQSFLGRWLLSKKSMISNRAMEFWAKKYPYKGWAFRIGDSPYNKPRGSWCKTLNGLIRWKMTMNPLGQTPTGFHNYKGYISKGIDLAAMVKGERLESYFGETIMAVEEVTSLVTVSQVQEIG